MNDESMIKIKPNTKSNNKNLKRNGHIKGNKLKLKERKINLNELNLYIRNEGKIFLI